MAQSSQLPAESATAMASRTLAVTLTFLENGGAQSLARRSLESLQSHGAQPGSTARAHYPRVEGCTPKAGSRGVQHVRGAHGHGHGQQGATHALLATGQASRDGCGQGVEQDEHFAQEGRDQDADPRERYQPGDRRPPRSCRSRSPRRDRPRESVFVAHAKGRGRNERSRSANHQAAQGTRLDERLTITIAPQGSRLGISVSKDLVVTKIQPGGAVENHNAANPSARLEAGDKLLNVNGKPATNAVDVGRAVALRGAGDVVAIIAPSAVPAGLMVRGGRGPAPTDQDVVAMLAGRSPSFASLQGVRLFGGNRCGKRCAAVVHHPAFQDLLVGRQILDAIAGDDFEDKARIDQLSVQLAAAYKKRIAAVAG